MSLYLDYNASAPIDPRVLEVMVDVYLHKSGNADSRTHNFGEQARLVVENARKQVAHMLYVQPNEIIFTSGATESNNIAIQGLTKYAKESGKNHIITSSIEHKSVLETVKSMEKNGFEVDIISPNASGRIGQNDVLNKIKENTLLVTIMHVNNETGIIQPVKEIGHVLREKNILFHIDATQSCGKLIDEIKELEYDMLSFSAHKLRGPQGIGVLVLKKKGYQYPPISPITYGGQQEKCIRPGTIPTALVAGCGKACELAEKEQLINKSNIIKIKNILCKLLKQSGLEYKFNGDQANCVDNTVNLCLNGISSEALMISTKEYCSISNGSACTSKTYSPSYVLTAMGISTDEIENSIRISWGPETNICEFERYFSEFLKIAKNLVE